MNDPDDVPGVIREFREIRPAPRGGDRTVVRLLATPVVAALATTLLLLALRAAHAAGAVQVVLVGLFVLVAGVASVAVATASDRKQTFGSGVSPWHPDRSQQASAAGAGPEPSASPGTFDVYDLPSGSSEHCLVCGGPARNADDAPGRWACLLCGARFAADATRPWPPVVVAPERMTRTIP